MLQGNPRSSNGSSGSHHQSILRRSPRFLPQNNNRRPNSSDDQVPSEPLSSPQKTHLKSNPISSNPVEKTHFEKTHTGYPGNGPGGVLRRSPRFAVSSPVDGVGVSVEPRRSRSFSCPGRTERNDFDGDGVINFDRNGPVTGSEGRGNVLRRSLRLMGFVSRTNGLDGFVVEEEEGKRKRGSLGKTAKDGKLDYEMEREDRTICRRSLRLMSSVRVLEGIGSGTNGLDGLVKENERGLRKGGGSLVENLENKRSIKKSTHLEPCNAKIKNEERLNERRMSLRSMSGANGGDKLLKEKEAKEEDCSSKMKQPKQSDSKSGRQEEKNDRRRSLRLLGLAHKVSEESEGGFESCEELLKEKEKELRNGGSVVSGVLATPRLRMEGKKRKIENVDDIGMASRTGDEDCISPGWTRDQEMALHKAYLIVRPSPHFWKKVSKMSLFPLLRTCISWTTLDVGLLKVLGCYLQGKTKKMKFRSNFYVKKWGYQRKVRDIGNTEVPGKSAQECFDRIHSDLQTPPEHRPRLWTNKATTSPLSHFSLSAGKPLRQHKTQDKRVRTNKQRKLLSTKIVRHLLRKHTLVDKSQEADLFSVFENTTNTSTKDFPEMPSSPSTSMKQNIHERATSSHKKPLSRLRNSSSACSISPEVLKKVKNMALHEKYIDQLHCREERRRVASAKASKALVADDGADCNAVRKIDVKTAKTALASEARDFINHFHRMQADDHLLKNEDSESSDGDDEDEGDPY
ncbi:hypothetical protein QJS10_CPB13g00307 [Acorus calamus]|uniref:Uncharacterized protein n=1 Tax=Acorus calamus TaxID=4465 RepID=A0AAV9DFD5_ACOCL|nr:hypothetical protein QJS10_CPB13g00307 [Acorus calamus]